MQPTRSYLICATPRSGSTLLCEALENTGIAGKPKEYFEALRATGLPRRPKEYFTTLQNQEIIDLLGDYSRLDHVAAKPAVQNHSTYLDYITGVLNEGTTANGVFGAKVMWGYFDDFISNMRDIPALKHLPTADLLATAFPRLSYIWMIRRDKVRQAISLWKAIQTNAWREDGAESLGGQAAARQHESHKRELHFCFEAIEHLIQQIEEHERAWQRYFEMAAIAPYMVYYEDLAANYEGITLQLLHELRIPIPKQLVFAGRRMKRQADALSQEWVKRYRALSQSIEGSIPKS